MLIACSACARHVREEDAVCPFCCAVRAPPGPGAPRVFVAGRLRRAAFLTLGVTVAGCSLEPSGPVLAYGCPPPGCPGALDAGPEGGPDASTDGAADSGVDAGADATDARTD
jgi:hypothetical protein